MNNFWKAFWRWVLGLIIAGAAAYYFSQGVDILVNNLQYYGFLP